MNKIKILYTIPNFDTAGSGKALLNIALGLDRSRFEPHILCLHNKGEFFKTVEQSGIPVHVFDYIPKERPFFRMIKNCFKVSKKIKEINPDVVHSFHYSSNYTEALSVKLAGKKWVFTKKNMNWSGGSKRAWKLRSLLANRIIVQNTDMINEFYQNSKKTMLISRGVVVDKFKKSEPDFSIREQMKTKSEQRILICVANFVPVKGIETLINAFDKIKNNYPDWVVWFIGDNQNEYGKQLQMLVSSLSLNDRIIFSGKQQNVTAYLNHSELFVLPTLNEGRKEGSPVALLEAMANEKVVLGSNVPGIKDQLCNFPDHLFQPKNVDDLAQKLSYFMGLNPSELALIGNQFLDLVTNDYPIALEIEKHEEFYLSLF